MLLGGHLDSAHQTSMSTGSYSLVERQISEHLAWVGPEGYISNSFSGDADDTIQGPHLEQQSPWMLL
jgi:hypothetical protein